jgi:DNA-binding transcriptional LysR family regulator
LVSHAVPSIHDLRLADVITFLAVRRAGTVTGAARELDVTPSQVSKAIARLEGQLKVPLLHRSSRGVVVSDAAARLVPHLEELINQLRLLERPRPEGMAELCIAAPSYLCAFSLPVIARAQPGLRLRALLLAPALVRAYASDNLFDVALTVGPERFPASWVTARVGQLEKGLYASPTTARRLGKGPIAPEKLREVPFVTPVIHTNGQLMPVDDGCPIDPSARRLGHEVATIGIGLELAACSEQVVFGPAVAAAPYLAAGALVAVDVAGWAVGDVLFLACNGDRVLARTQRSILEALTLALARAQRRQPLS